jgi:hypothetical protein
VPTDELIVPNDGATAIQEHPEETPDADQVPTYGERNEKLPEQLRNAIKGAVKEFQEQDKYDRRREVLRDRRNRFYERGYQHIYDNYRSGGFVQGQPGQVISVDGRDIQCPNKIDSYNVFGPCLEILESILTQNPPGIDFRPINPNISEDMEASETAEGYRKMFDRSNDIKSIQTDIVRMMGVSGRTIIWTRTEANAQKFGFNDDGTTPKQMETATVHGTLESKVSILAKSQEDTPYVFLFDDPDLKIAKSEYPDFADKIKAGEAGIGESEYERIARLGILGGTRQYANAGDSLTHVVTRMHCWLRPCAFIGEQYKEVFEEAEESDVNEDGGAMTVREKLLQLFPSGCHAVFVGDVYVGSWDESMDDALCIGFPYAGDGMSRQALMDRGVVIQDRFNDDRNAYAEVKDYGWPSTWVNGDDSDFDALVNQKADPFAIRLKKARNGTPMDAEFYREQDPQIPETFVKDTDGLLQLLYFMLATPPALFGEAQQDQKTASGFAQMRAQAMGRLGIIWASIQSMMSVMYYQAALCASNNPDHSEEIVVPSEGGQNVTLRLERLRKGKFGAYADEDSSFPESTAAKRQQLAQIVAMAAQSPVGAQIFESPDNWELFKQLLGFPELVLIEAEARNKQVREIEILLQQSPIPPSPQELQAVQMQHAAATLTAQGTGGAVPPPIDPTSLLKTSVPVSELDYHEYEAKKCREWLSSEACWREIAEGNQAGIMNVTLHAKEHMKLAAPPTQQAPVLHGALSWSGKLEDFPELVPEILQGAGLPPSNGASKPALPPPVAHAPHATRPAHKPVKPQGELGAPNAISAPPGGPGAQTM